MKKENVRINKSIQLELDFFSSESALTLGKKVVQDEESDISSDSKVISIMEGIKKLEEFKEKEIIDYILLHAKRF